MGTPLIFRDKDIELGARELYKFMHPLGDKADWDLTMTSIKKVYFDEMVCILKKMKAPINVGKR